MSKYFNNKPVPVRVQKKNESLFDAIEKLEKSCRAKDYELKLIIQTQLKLELDRLFETKTDIEIIKSMDLQVVEIEDRLLENWKPELKVSP